MGGMECDVCFNQYDEDERKPRALSCGYTLCTVCVTEGISEGHLSCPFCREPQNATTANDVRINFSLLKVIRSFAATAGLATQQNSDENPAPSRTTLVPELHAGACAEHGSYRLFWCLKCQLWVCRDCTVVEHPAGTCSVIAIKKALRRMKEEEKNLADQTVTSGNSLASELCDYQTELNENNERHDEQLRAVRELKENQMEVKQLLNKEYERVEGCIEYLQNALEKMSVACRELAEETTVEGTTAARHECQRLRRRLDRWIKQSSDSLEEADVIHRSEKLQKKMKTVMKAAGIQTGEDDSNDSIQITSAIIKRLMKFPSSLTELTIRDLRFISNPFPVFATLDDESRAAQITMENGVIHLYALRKTTIPSTAFKVPYWHVLTLTKEPSQVFFDISWEGQKKGRVCIQLSNKDSDSKSFRQRCTGEVTNSFVNSRMIRVLNGNRICVGGDGRSGLVVEHEILPESGDAHITKTSGRQYSTGNGVFSDLIEVPPAPRIFLPSHPNLTENRYCQNHNPYESAKVMAQERLSRPSIANIPNSDSRYISNYNLYPSVQSMPLTSVRKSRVKTIHDSISTENLVTLCTFNGIICFSIWFKSTQIAQFGSNQGKQYVSLGRVTSGMDVIQQAANYRNITDVTVSDCGLIVT